MTSNTDRAKQARPTSLDSEQKQIVQPNLIEQYDAHVANLYKTKADNPPWKIRKTKPKPSPAQNALKPSNFNATSLSSIAEVSSKSNVVNTAPESSAASADFNLALLNEISNPSIVKKKSKPTLTNTPAKSGSIAKVPAVPAKDKMPVCFDDRPELDHEFLIRIVSDVKVQIEIACSSFGYFDEGSLPVTGNAYLPSNQPTGADLLVGNTKVDACLYDPLKNFEKILVIFLNAVDSWGARGRHMQEFTLPSINRILRGVMDGYEGRACRMIHQLLGNNGDLNQWYIATFDVYARGLKKAMEEIRGLVEFLFQICDQGNELKAESRKASVGLNSNYGYGKPINTKTSSSYIKANPKDDADTGNRNLSSIAFDEEPMGPKKKFVHAEGPTVENLARMTKEEYAMTRYDDHFYAIPCSPEYLAWLSGTNHDTGPTWAEGSSRAERVKKLKTTPDWKKNLSDRHHIDSLHVRNQDIKFFEVAYGLAKAALAKGEECVKSVRGSKVLANKMKVEFDMFKEHANEWEVRLLSGGGGVGDSSMDEGEDFESWCPEEEEEEEVMLEPGVMGKQNQRMRVLEGRPPGEA